MNKRTKPASLNLDSIPQPFQAEVRQFPEPLRELIRAELAAGNSIVSVGAGFPAPPCGSLLQFAQPISPSPASAGKGLKSCEFPNATLQSGYSDTQGHYFVMNPPPPPPAEPDMDAIRDSVNAAAAPWATREGRAALAARPPEPRYDPERWEDPTHTAYARFVASMTIDHEKWREGIGYDLEALEQANPDELARIRTLLTNPTRNDWRDIQALAAIPGKESRNALTAALKHGSPVIRMAVMRYAPGVGTDQDRLKAILHGLREAEPYKGLSETLDQVEEVHPPEVMDALLRGTLEREGGIASQFAATLLFLHGLANSRLDLSERPFFLRFNTPEPAARQAVFHELCGRIRVDPTPYLRPARNPCRKARPIAD